MGMRRLGSFWLALGLLAVLVSGAGCVCPPPAETGLTPATATVVMAAEIDHYVTQRTQDHQFSGVVLATFAGEPVIAQSYGWADRERGIANRVTTRFPIGSLTKSFTALAILSLQEQGRLSVNDPICAYIEPCPLAWQAISIHQLLTHTAGIPDYVAMAAFWERLSHRQVMVADLIDLIAAQPLQAPPGRQFAYSSSGYVLLGYIIGHVAYPELPVELAEQRFLQEVIFTPLAMGMTSDESCLSELSDNAIGYGPTWHEAGLCHPSALFAMGNLSSTAHDLLRWAEAMGEDGLIAPTLRIAMTTPYIRTHGYESYYGYGWYISQAGGQRVIWHDGAAPGYRAYLQRALDAETFVIVLSNYEVAPVNMIGQEIAAIMLRRAKDAARAK
jgi:CubicO group peptidase (beta-lactamase class C family)